MRLLCFSEDAAIGQDVCEEAAKQNWSAKHVLSRGEMAEVILDFNPDMLLVEIGSSAELSWLESQNAMLKTPVFILNGELTEDFVCRAFELGADGLLPKSLFSRRFLVARVNAFLRRQGLMGSRRMVPRLRMVFDSQRYKVEVDGTGLTLTLTEFKILNLLATEHQRTVSRAEIQAEVFDKTTLNRRSLDVHVCALRKKLKPFQLDIESSRGIGYRLGPCSRPA